MGGDQECSGGLGGEWGQGYVEGLGVVGSNGW